MKKKMMRKTKKKMKKKGNSRMYKDAQTWNPFRGCDFGCRYCEPSFKRQAKRQKQNCKLCYSFEPHFHPERLKTLPGTPIVFVCGVGDLSFCRDDHMREIIGRVVEHDEKHADRTYYFQSKRPSFFAPYIAELSKNCVLVTTLETNRDDGYEKISKAPPPSERHRQFLELDYPRKVVTIEPVLDFDLDPFVDMILAVNPEYVWLGYNSQPKSVSLPEPDTTKMSALMNALKGSGIAIKEKDLRGISTVGSGASCP